MRPRTNNLPGGPLRDSGATGFAIFLVFFLLPVFVKALAQDLELRTAAEIRRLTPQQAAQRLPVRLRGVVTFYDGALFSRFVQDETAGIYLGDSPNTPALQPGQLVEIEGTTSPGEYAPIIAPERVRIIGEAPLPEAKPVTVEHLASGAEDSQFVEVIGIVRSVRYEEESRNYLIDVALGGERFTACSRQLPVANAEQLVDSVVKVRGVYSTLFNRLRQLFGFRLLIPRETDLVVVKPAPANPFDVAAQDISSLLRFAAQGTFGSRVKVVGTVVYQEPGVALFIQDEQEGLHCQTKRRTPLRPGDRVEVLGFPAKGEYTPMLQDTVYRRVGSGTPVQPAEIGLDEALAGTHDCRLVRIQAKLLEHTQRGREQFMVLQKDNFVFQAFLAQNEDGSGFSEVPVGSEVVITGICLIERGSSWQAGENWRARSFRILLPSPADVTVLRSPPWWNVRRVLWMAAALGIVALATSAWVAILRRRVQHQTKIIRQQLQVEATLKERYVDLFENANDMVFTHDVTGRITSINEAGERLLQRSRREILDRNLVDLMAEDQRTAAAQWLGAIVKETESPTVEWDFVNAVGQRVRLEISTRLIGEKGAGAEIEGIARDITERRRLERELLEISNREQRRIGHDLHDGVCQQLAGIAYLVDILGDRLQEQGTPEAAAEAERIGRLINEASAQARGVARGLFPVRLEESGLVSALEELADNTSSRFKVTCQFSAESPPPVVDNEIALHLYFIAQEALVNAIKHGKAANVTVTVTPKGDRFALAVRDDGAGFESPGAGRGGMGIRIMRYRARVIGASLNLESKPGGGTRIECVFDPVIQREPEKEKHD